MYTCVDMVIELSKNGGKYSASELPCRKNELRSFRLLGCRRRDRELDFSALWLVQFPMRNQSHGDSPSHTPLMLIKLILSLPVCHVTRIVSALTMRLASSFVALVGILPEENGCCIGRRWGNASGCCDPSCTQENPRSTKCLSRRTAAS